MTTRIGPLLREQDWEVRRLRDRMGVSPAQARMLLSMYWAYPGRVSVEMMAVSMWNAGWRLRVGNKEPVNQVIFRTRLALGHDSIPKKESVGWRISRELRDRIERALRP